MTRPDYRARAELYLGSDHKTAIAQGARSFATAAQAIRFAFEEAAPVSLHGAMLRVAGVTYAGDELAALYRSAEFPLPRKPGARRSRSRRTRTNRSGALYAFARSAWDRPAAMA